MRALNWPNGYITGHCLTSNHRACKAEIWNPAQQNYTKCKCKVCLHFSDVGEEEEEFFGETEMDQTDPFIWKADEIPELFEEEVEEFFS